MLIKAVIVSLFLGLSACATAREVLVRVTFWTPQDCPYGWAKSTGGILTVYKSAAVDPKLIPYGTTIRLPGFQKELIAEDTGSAVKSKQASRGSAKKLLSENAISVQQFQTLSQVPVIDVCVPTTRDVTRLASEYPEFVTVTLDYGRKPNTTSSTTTGSLTSTGGYTSVAFQESSRRLQAYTNND